MGDAMPKWLKITLIVVGTITIILMIGGFLAARAVKQGIENFEVDAEQATADGKEYGANATLADCVDTGVQRTSDCSLTNLTCAPLAGAYMWGCLEAAPFDQSFCNAVPDSEENEAVIDWARRACTVHGEHENDYCTVAMAVVPGFCTAHLDAD
jgi:hypothetical protein